MINNNNHRHNIIMDTSTCSGGGEGGDVGVGAGSSRPVVTLKQTLSAHTSDINGLQFSQGAGGACTLATCSSDKTVRLWAADADFAELPCSPLVGGHSYSVHKCHFMPDTALQSSSLLLPDLASRDDILATCSTDGKCIIWNSKSGERVAVFQHPSKTSIRVCEFSPSGELLLTGSDDEKICIWNVEKKKLIRSVLRNVLSVNLLI